QQYFLQNLGRTDLDSPFSFIKTDDFIALEFFCGKGNATYILPPMSMQNKQEGFCGQGIIGDLQAEAWFQIIPTPLWISHYARFLLREFDITPEDPDTFYLPELLDSNFHFASYYTRKFVDVLNQEEYIPASSYRETIFPIVRR
ncbi:MAG: hypothetical protein AAF518_25785, partial [Spirochaetota bacterium]